MTKHARKSETGRRGFLSWKGEACGKAESEMWRPRRLTGHFACYRLLCGPGPSLSLIVRRDYPLQSGHANAPASPHPSSSLIDLLNRRGMQPATVRSASSFVSRSARTPPKTGLYHFACQPRSFSRLTVTGSCASGRENEEGSKQSWHSRKLPIAGATAGVASMAAFGLALSAEECEEKETLSIAERSTVSLFRSYLVWTMLGIPRLVDAAPGLLDNMLRSSIPGVSLLTETVVRHTFFPQFIPGESAVGCVPAMEYLRRRNVGAALNYSAEADGEIESDHAELDRLREVETALDVQGALEQRMYAEGWERGSSAFALKVVRCTILSYRLTYRRA